MWSPYYFRNVPVTRHSDSQTESAEYERTAGTAFQQSLDFICDGSDISHIAAERRSARNDENSFSKLGSPEDPNILTNFSVGIEISKSDQDIKMSLNVSHSSIEKILCALHKAISPTLEQNKKSSKCNHEVGDLDTERNRVELVKNSTEIKKNVERECFSNATPKGFDYLENNSEVSIQSGATSNDSGNLHSPSVASEDSSSEVISRDIKNDLHAKRKSVASSISNSGSTPDFPAEMQSTEFENLVESSVYTGPESLCVNDEIMTEKDILSATNEDLVVYSNEVKGSALHENRDYENEDVSENTLHTLAKKTVNVRTDCNADRKCMSQGVASETTNKIVDEKVETDIFPEEKADSYLKNDHVVECSAKISSGPKDVKASESEVSGQTKTAFDVSSTVKQKEGVNENTNIENNSKAKKTLKPTGSQMEIFSVEVAAPAPNLNSDGVRNMRDEDENFSTLIEKNAHEHKVEVYTLSLSKMLTETSDKNRFENTSLQEICSDEMKSTASSECAISFEVQEKEILANKLNLTQITDLETLKTKENGKSDKSKEKFFENSPIKSNFPSELHVPNRNQKIEESIENLECCHQNNSGKDFPPCTTDEIAVEENASEYIDIENSSESSKMKNSDAKSEVKCLESEPSCAIEKENIEELETENCVKIKKNHKIMSDVKAGDCKGSEISVLKNSLSIQSDSTKERNMLGTTNKEIVSRFNFDSKSMASPKNNENKLKSLSSSISEKSLSELIEHDNTLLEIYHEGGVSTDKQCNRSESIIDTSRKEYLQNMLESGTSSVEPELNLKKSKITLDSELESQKLLGEKETLVENNAVPLAEATSTQSEEELNETNQTMWSSVVGSKKLKSNAQNDYLIFDKDILAQPNMAIKMVACKHIDSDTKHEKCCTQRVVDSIVSDADLSCSITFLDSNKESKEIKKEAAEKLNADNTVNFAQNVEADNGLLSESNEESQETMNMNELVVASDEESIIEQNVEVELGCTPLKVRTENILATEEPASDQKAIKNVKSADAPLKVLCESTLGSDEESIAKEKEIPCTEVADTPLKELSEDILALEEEVTLEQKVTQSPEVADSPLEVSSECVPASEKVPTVVPEKQIIENASWKVLEEESTVEQKANQSAQLADSPLKVVYKNTLASDKEFIAKENEIPSTEVADTRLKELSENILASEEEVTLEHNATQSPEEADSPLKISSECVPASKNEPTVVPEKQIIKHEKAPWKVLSENPLASEEESTIQQKANQCVQLADLPLKVLYKNSLASSKESIVKVNEIPSTEVADTPLKELSEAILASEEEVTREQNATQSPEVANPPLKVSSECVPASQEEPTVVPEKQIIEHERKVSEEESTVEQKANQSVQLADLPVKVLYENTLASDKESKAEQKAIPKVENVHAEHLVLQKPISDVVLDTTSSNKLVIEELLEESKNNESACNRDFGLSQMKISLENKVQFIQNKSLVSDANNSHTGNAEIKSPRLESKNGNTQKSSTKTISEASVMNNSFEHSLRSVENTTKNNLNYVKEDDTVSEDSLNKSVESDSGKEGTLEISKNCDISGNNSELSTSKKTILDKKCCIAENENVLQKITKYEDIAKNILTINTNEKDSKRRSLNSSSRESEDASTETPEKDSTVRVDSQLPDKETSFSLVEDLERMSVSQNAQSELNGKQVEHNSNDGLSLDTPLLDKITHVTLSNDSKKVLLISKHLSNKEALNEDQSLDTSVNMDNANQVKTSSKEITAVKENLLDTTYVDSSLKECKKMFELCDSRNGECENASNYDSESGSSISAYDEIDAAPTRNRTFPDTAIITNMIVEENETAENIVSTSSDKMLSKIRHSKRNLIGNLASKRSDRCKSEEPIASSSRTTAKPIQARRSSESLVRRISTEFQSKIEAGPKRQSPRIAAKKNQSLDSGLNTQKTLQKTRSFQEDMIRTKITRSKTKGAVDSSESDQSELNAETVSTPVNLRARTRNTAVSETIRSSNPLKKVYEESTTLRDRGRNKKSLHEDSVPAKGARAKAKGTVNSSESEQSEFNAELVSTPTKPKARTRNTALSETISSSNPLKKVSFESTTLQEKGQNTKNLQEHSVPAKGARAKVKGTVDSSESDQSEFSAELVSTPTKQKARTRNTALSAKIRASNSLEKVSEESTTPRKRSRDNATAAKQHSTDESASSFNATRRNRTRNADLEPNIPVVSTRKTRTGK